MLLEVLLFSKFIINKSNHTKQKLVKLQALDFRRWFYIYKCRNKIAANLRIVIYLNRTKLLNQNC